MGVYVSVDIDLNIKTNARKLVKFKIFIMGSSATSLCSNLTSAHATSQIEMMT